MTQIKLYLDGGKHIALCYGCTKSILAPTRSYSLRVVLRT